MFDGRLLSGDHVSSLFLYNINYICTVLYAVPTRLELGNMILTFRRASFVFLSSTSLPFELPKTQI